jgi:hypothetical protein
VKTVKNVLKRTFLREARAWETGISCEATADDVSNRGGPKPGFRKSVLQDLYQEAKNLLYS